MPSINVGVVVLNFFGDILRQRQGEDLLGFVVCSKKVKWEEKENRPQTQEVARNLLCGIGITLIEDPEENPWSTPFKGSGNLDNWELHVVRVTTVPKTVIDSYNLHWCRAIALRDTTALLQQAGIILKAA
jgi:hypothetical protein